MDVKAIFKGVTYESLSDPEFMRIAGQKISSLDRLQEEFDAAKAEDRRDEKEAPASCGIPLPLTVSQRGGLPKNLLRWKFPNADPLQELLYSSLECLHCSLLNSEVR